jgi:hypothetical protein
MRKSLGALVLALSLVGSAANAQLAFSSFGPGDTYQTGFGATISGPNSAATQWTQASQFTSGASGILDTVRVVTFYAGGSTGNMHVTLHQDNAGSIGSSMIDWSYFDNTGGDHFTTLNNPFPFVTLSAGTKYWIRMSAEDTMWHGWNFAPLTTPAGRVAWSQDAINWNYADGATLMAFDVTVSPVPEPGTMIALGLGASALLARRRRKA